MRFVFLRDLCTLQKRYIRRAEFMDIDERLSLLLLVLMVVPISAKQVMADEVVRTDSPTLKCATEFQNRGAGD